MRCIFCKEDSISYTVEHIIPESLGNIEYILPKGVVCDKCNNYFSREIEKPLLSSPYFLHARFRNRIPNKKNHIPSIQGYHLESATLIEILSNKDGLSLYPFKAKDEENFIKSIARTEKGSLIIPNPTEFNNNDKYLMSRFLGKIALEVRTHRVLEVEGGVDEVVDKIELDLLRNYVRRGSLNLLWSYHERRIYPEGFQFTSEKGEVYDVPHEFMLLYTDKQELYLVVAIFGVEYVLNFGGSEIDGYIDWLNKHDQKSPLYP